MKWLKSMFAQSYDEDMDFSDENENDNMMFKQQPNPVRQMPREAPPSYVSPPQTQTLSSIRATQSIKDKKEVSLTELVTVTMSGYEATGDVAKYIRDKKPQIVNMERLSDIEMQRAIDYLSGVSYAVNGTLEMFASKIYVMLPESIALKRD
ncbi:MAG: hypothetical protein ATN31_00670 [Candidatus Epulonipiscioides saccharophilum]|nr:MAG: hypothetical protein ATN31_00670 [Epulopiscium sp. AS2M-Bin001]